MLFKEYRLKAGLTQEELAEKLDITWRQMQRIEKEKSRPSFETLKKLILVLNISDEDIVKYIKEIC